MYDSNAQIPLDVFARERFFGSSLGIECSFGIAKHRPPCTISNRYRGILHLLLFPEPRAVVRERRAFQEGLLTLISGRREMYKVD